MSSYAIYGGTFDPFTEAHKAICEQLLEQRLVDKVLIVPTVVDYHRKGKVRWLTDRERIDVIKRMINHSKQKERIIIDEREINLKEQCACSEELTKTFIGNRRYVHTLLDIVRGHCSYDEFYTVVGEDSYNAIKTWYDYKTILKYSKLIVVKGRAGVNPTDQKIDCDEIRIDKRYADVSSTKIRAEYGDRENGVKLYMDAMDKKFTDDYGFTVEGAWATIHHEWLRWANSNGFDSIVLGISGGKDSTVAAALAAKIFGPKNVYGVLMPNGKQSDQADAERVIKLTKINRLECNIGKPFKDMLAEIKGSGLKEDISEDTRINLPPRLRMSCLYAIAQTLGACVVKTDNLSEMVAGYYTLWGDGAGSYAPLRGLTVTEVRKLGLYLGLPKNLVMKKPGDGLQPQGDEERLGFTYEELDKLIRTGTDYYSSYKSEFQKMCEERFHKNQFKLLMERVPGPAFKNLPNYFRYCSFSSCNQSIWD